MAHNNRNGPNFISKVPGWITGLIAFVTAVVGFVKLWQGDTGLVTTVLLAIGVGGGTLGCAYLAFKRTLPLVLGGKGTWQYRRWRPWALAGLVIIPLLTASGLSYHLYEQAQPPTKVIILVARFHGPDSDKHQVTNKVLNDLHRALARYDDVKVEGLGQVITEEEGSDAARAEGKNHQAAIVIWGWYRATEKAVELLAHFEVLRSPEYMPELEPEKGHAQTITVADLESFMVKTDLSAGLAYLSLFTAGMVRYAAEDWDGAIVRFGDALSQIAEEPVPALDQSTVHFYRGVAYYGKDDYDRAIVDYDQAIQLQPDLAKAYINRGLACYNKGDYNRAFADYDQAIQLRPDYALAYNNRGVAYTNKGDLDRAFADFDQAIQLQHDYAKAYNNRGVAHDDSGDLEQAIRDYDKAIELDPTLTRTYNNRGLAYYDSGDLEQAIRDYSEAIELDPDYANAYINRGVAHYDSGDLEQAISDYDKAIELNPDYADSYVNRGIAHCESDDLEKAIRDFEQYLQLAPNASDREVVINVIEQLKSEFQP
jgi:tetratricopeptide (TPR) repeat protein